LYIIQNKKQPHQQNIFEKRFIEEEIKQGELTYYINKEKFIIEQKGELKTLFYPPYSKLSNIIKISQDFNIDISLQYQCYRESDSIPASRFFVLSFQDPIR
jgi:hypothetical protein